MTPSDTKGAVTDTPMLAEGVRERLEAWAAELEGVARTLAGRSMTRLDERAAAHASNLRALLADHARQASTIEALRAQVEATQDVLRKHAALKDRFAYWTSCALATVDGERPSRRSKMEHSRFQSIAEKMAFDCMVFDVPVDRHSRVTDAISAIRRAASFSGDDKAP